TFARLSESVGDVVLVSQIFLAFLGCFRFFGGDEPSCVIMKLSGVAGDRGESGFEYEAKQVVRIRQENAVSLCLGQWQRSGDFPDASQIVALIRVQRRK